MNAPVKITSPSFPNGLPHLRSEAEVRTVHVGARACPFCGVEPGYAQQRAGFWLVGCENDDCDINPQAGSRVSASNAWAKWNRRT